MAKKGRAHVKRDEIKAVADELRSLADGCDLAIKTMGENRDSLFIEGLPTVHAALERVRSFVGNAIGNAHIADTSFITKAISADLDKLKARRETANKKVAEKGPDYESKKKG